MNNARWCLSAGIYKWKSKLGKIWIVDDLGNGDLDMSFSSWMQIGSFFHDLLNWYPTCKHINCTYIVYLW